VLDALDLKSKANPGPQLLINEAPPLRNLVLGQS
jgi:hypothetical protein